MQEAYEQCQATFDPNAIAALLHAHPYHLDALLTMHDLHRSMSENAYAGAAAAASPQLCPPHLPLRMTAPTGSPRTFSTIVWRVVRDPGGGGAPPTAVLPPAARRRFPPDEMLERCLYALEMAWHPTFSPAAATAHVPFEEGNMPLFIALFR